MYDTVDLKSLAKKLSSIDYYTNHGPNAKSFEERVGQYFDSEAVAVSSLYVAAAMIGVEFISIDINNVKDERILSGIDIAAERCGIEPSISTTVAYDLNTLELQLDSQTQNYCDSIIFVQNPFENIGFVKTCAHQSLCVVVSHERGELIDTFSGATILSSDKELLERMRNVRSSYGVRRLTTVPVTSNGRFSEVQAVMGLQCLEHL